MKDELEEADHPQKYRQRILSAKPSLQSKEQKQRRRSICQRVDPIDQYQYESIKKKLALKLKQIYQGKITTKSRSKSKSKSKHQPHQNNNYNKSKQNTNANSSANVKGSLINAYKKKQYENMLNKNNLNMMNRILTIKPTIKQFKDKSRQRNLRSYSKLTAKFYETNVDDEMYYNYQKQLLNNGVIRHPVSQSKTKRRRRKRKNKNKQLQIYNENDNRNQDQNYNQIQDDTII